MGLNGRGIYDLNGWGSYFLREMLKNTDLQGSTLSGPCMTTGFVSFELPTRGLLQKGRDHSPPKFYFVRSPAFWLVQLLLCVHWLHNVCALTDSRVKETLPLAT